MAADLRNVRATLRVSLQAPGHERERGAAQLRAAARGLAEDDAAVARVLLGGEGRVAREEVREQDAERPHLGGRGAVRLLAQDLGRRVRGRAEEERVEGRGRERVRDDGAAEVDELDLS